MNKHNIYTIQIKDRNYNEFYIVDSNNQNLDYIDIQLTDEYDNEINFNGIDVFICLQFDTIRSDLPQDNNLHALLEKNAN